MAGDHGSRRFVKVQWAIAFTLGLAAGTLSTTLFGITYTLWALAGCSAMAGAIGMFEWFGQKRLLGLRRQSQARKPERMNLTPPPSKTSKGNPPRRGQLHAITGRKAADPPSSGAS